MYNMKIFTYIFIMLLGLSSCLPKPIVSTKTATNTTTDSKTVVRDTIIKVEQNNAALIASLEALKNAKQPLVYRDGRASISVEYKRDTIYAECQCDSVAIKAQLFDQYFSKVIETENENTITKFKRANLFNTLGIIAFLAILLLIIGFIIKLVINGINPFKK